MLSEIKTKLGNRISIRHFRSKTVAWGDHAYYVTSACSELTLINNILVTFLQEDDKTFWAVGSDKGQLWQRMVFDAVHARTAVSSS